MADNVAFHDLSPDKFPFTVEMFLLANDELVHSMRVEGPGAMEVPGQKQLPGPVWIRITWPDGTVSESGRKPPEGAA